MADPTPPCQPLPAGLPRARRPSLAGLPRRTPRRVRPPQRVFGQQPGTRPALGVHVAGVGEGTAAQAQAAAADAAVEAALEPLERGDLLVEAAAPAGARCAASRPWSGVRLPGRRGQLEFADLLDAQPDVGGGADEAPGDAARCARTAAAHRPSGAPRSVPPPRSSRSPTRRSRCRRRPRPSAGSGSCAPIATPSAVVDFTFGDPATAFEGPLRSAESRLWARWRTLVVVEGTIPGSSWPLHDVRLVF